MPRGLAVLASADEVVAYLGVGPVTKTDADAFLGDVGSGMQLVVLYLVVVDGGMGVGPVEVDADSASYGYRTVKRSSL